MSIRTDFLIIGGGVIAFTLALNLRKLFPSEKITIIEKETKIAKHGSGRNSGVLHAGFYYSADSLKAQFTRDGNLKWQNYCEEHKLKINKCGKLIVAKNESELSGLKELKKRGENNSVPLDFISEKEAKEIEPRVKTYQQALWSPTTASVDPSETMQQLVKNLKQEKITLMMGEEFYDYQDQQIITNKNKYICGYIINAAGLYADKIANKFNFSNNYKIIPFKGLYLYLKKQAYQPRTNIYPVPNLEHPFLGVHYTLTSSGQAKIGPTSTPAFWRENYKGLDNFNLNEFIEIISKETSLFIKNSFGFRNLALKEMRKYLKSNMIKDAALMLDNVKKEDFAEWGKPGIRAQLINLKNNKLEMDFIYEGDSKSFHILNAVSPAYTCSWSFTEFLSKKIKTLCSK